MLAMTLMLTGKTIDARKASRWASSMPWRRSGMFAMPSQGCGVRPPETRSRPVFSTPS